MNNPSPFFEKLYYRGLDALNDLIPKRQTDFITEKFKSILWVGMIISLVMMFTSPYGALYSTFLRPVLVNTLLLHRVQLDARFYLTPESGMHWMTIFIYFFIAYKFLQRWEKQEIDMPIHKVCWIFCLMMVSLFIPFEFVYLALYDIFHSIPVYNYPTFLGYGFWLDFPKNIYKTILFVDGFFVIGGTYVLWYLSREIKERYEKPFVKGYFNNVTKEIMAININKTKIRVINFNKISKILLFGYVVTTVLWVLVPLYSPVEFVWGTKYFPQTIYPEYGYYDEHGITQHPPDENYGIINEFWVPNDLVKVLNHVSKAFSVLFMFYTFTPARQWLNIN